MNITTLFLKMLIKEASEVLGAPPRNVPLRGPKLRLRHMNRKENEVRRLPSF